MKSSHLQPTEGEEIGPNLPDPQIRCDRSIGEFAQLQPNNTLREIKVARDLNYRNTVVHYHA